MHHVHVWRSEGDFKELVLYHLYLGPGDLTQVAMVACVHLYLLSHLASPFSVLKAACTITVKGHLLKFPVNFSLCSELFADKTG